MPAIAVEILESVHQHRVLTARQIRALHMPAASLRWAQRILTHLQKGRLIEQARGPRGVALWFLTAHGADTIEAGGTLAEWRRRVSTPAQAAGPLRAHTLAVNDTGIAFVNAARERPGDDCGPLAWRHEIAHPCSPPRGRSATHLVIADALISYLQAAPDDSLILHQRFIELDRGTIPVDTLARKLARYAAVRDYRADATKEPSWRAYYRAFPAVLVVLASQGGAPARRRIAKTIALYASDPGRGRHGPVAISFTTLPELRARGPFAPVFINAEHPGHPVDWLGQVQTTRGRNAGELPEGW
ncbi:MAG TPA: replication-relaxation family protein [Solirubrobacteraceae bacterium]